MAHMINLCIFVCFWIKISLGNIVIKVIHHTTDNSTMQIVDRVFNNTFYGEYQIIDVPFSLEVNSWMDAQIILGPDPDNSSKASLTLVVLQECRPNIVQAFSQVESTVAFWSYSQCHLSTSFNTNERAIVPPVDILRVMTSVTDVALAQGVFRMVVLYDPNYGDIIRETVSRQGLSTEDVIVYNTNDFNHVSVRNELHKRRAANRFFVAVVTKESIDILEKARAVGVLGVLYYWVVLNIDIPTQTINQYIKLGDNVIVYDLRTQLTRWPRYTDSEQLQAMDFEAYVTIIAHQLLNSHNDVSQFMTLSSIKQTLLESSITPIYSTTTNSPGILRYRGSWNIYSKPQKFPLQYITEFSGFYGKVFNITTVPNKVFQIKLDNGTYTGLAFDILNELGKQYNFSYTITEPPDGKWGLEEESGWWNGMVGMVLREEVDFGVASFTISSHREAVIDFTTPFWRGSSAMVMRTRGSGNKLLVYLEPFQWQVWICWASVIPAAAISYWTALTNSPVEKALRFRTKQYRKKPFLEILHRIAGGVVGQGLPYVPKSWSARVILGTMWCYVLIMTAVYTGNLVAVFTVSRKQVPVDSLAELVAQSEYDVGMVDGQALVQVFSMAPAGIYREVWRKVEESDGLVGSLVEGFNKARRKNYIFMDDTKNLVSMVAETPYPEKCNLYIAKEEFFFTGYGFPLQENSPYLDLFNRAILRMVDSGHIDQWIKRYWPSQGECDLDSNRFKADPKSIVDIQGAFLILVAGVVLSLLALTVEVVSKICRQAFHGGDNCLRDAINWLSHCKSQWCPNFSNKIK